jgi:hypothetical protein
MATLQASDIVFYYTNTGSTTNPENSRGATINSSGSTIPDNTSNNIFDDVTGDQSAAGIQEYRCIAVKNNNGNGAGMLNTKVYISGYVRAAANFDTMYFALQNPTGGTNPVQTITTETTAPNANLFITKIGNTVSWTAEGAPSATLQFGTINAGHWMGIWLQRSVPVGAVAFSNRAVTITVVCETTGSPRHAVVKEFTLNTYKLFKDNENVEIQL